MASSPELTLEHLRPYVSVLFYDLRTAVHSADEFFLIVEANLAPSIGEAHEKGGRLGKIVPIRRKKAGRWEMVGCWYPVETLPSWVERVDDPTLTFYDVRHHLVLFGIGHDRRRDEPYSAIVCTDAPVKKKLIALMDELGVRRLPEEELVPSFLRGEAHRAWLHGVHHPVPTKASSKVLIGPDLREAIDPIDDQTFRLSAALSDTRSAKITADFRHDLPPDSPLRDLSSVDAIGRPPIGKRNESVGVSLSRGTLWTGMSKDFSHFLYELDELCAQVAEFRDARSTTADSGYQQRGYNMLARPEEGLNLDALGEAVDFSMELPQPSEEEQQDETNERVRVLYAWRERGEFLVNGAENERLFLDALYDGKKIARIRLQPILGDRGKAKLEVNVDKWEVELTAPERDILEHVLQGSAERTKVWYSKGYTVQGEEVFRLEFRDLPFTSWKWMPFRLDRKENPIRYEIKREKPGKSGLWDFDWKGCSLFEFVLNNIEPLFRPGKHEWFLICDDGSGEVADFVYLDPEIKRLRLIHVKAAGSEEVERTDRDTGEVTLNVRRIAPAKYEVVLGQATKNLRFLEPRLLAERLDTGGSSNMEKLTWISGKRVENRERAIKALRGMGAYLDRGLIVLQPHMSRSVWTKAEEDLWADKLGDADRIQLLRLRMLLAATGDACRRFGAIFEAWGVNDGKDDDAAFPRSDLRAPPAASGRSRARSPSRRGKSRRSTVAGKG
jgi:hypothetical protein